MKLLTVILSLTAASVDAISFPAENGTSSSEAHLQYSDAICLELPYK
jgi:hypothetical protein